MLRWKLLIIIWFHIIWKNVHHNMQIRQLPLSAKFFISYRKPKPIIFIIITNTNKTFLCFSSTNNSIIQLVINIFLANLGGRGRVGLARTTFTNLSFSITTLLYSLHLTTESSACDQWKQVQIYSHLNLKEELQWSEKRKTFVKKQFSKI